MTGQGNPSKYVWVLIFFLSMLLLTITLLMLFLSGGQDILEQGLIYAGSPLVVGNLDPAALGYLNMGMLKPLWEELWIGIFGIFCAIALKQNKKYAWMLSLMWGIMLIVNATIQGIYEVMYLNWSNPCMQTYLFLLIGLISVVGLLSIRNRFLGFEKESYE